MIAPEEHDLLESSILRLQQLLESLEEERERIADLPKGELIVLMVLKTEEGLRETIGLLSRRLFDI